MDQRRRDAPKHRPGKSPVDRRSPARKEADEIIRKNRDLLFKQGVRVPGRSQGETLLLVAPDWSSPKGILRTFYRFETFDPLAPFFSHVNSLAARVVQAELSKATRELIREQRPILGRADAG